MSTGRCGSTLLSNILRLHPDILSLSECFSFLGGPRAFPDGALSSREFWALLSQLQPDLRDLLARTRIPEILADLPQPPPADTAPIALVTLPHLGGTGALLEELHAYVAEAETVRACEHFDRIFGWLRRRFQRRVWVERSGGSLEYAEILRGYWPNAKFVYLVRDGRDTAYSMAGHPMFRVRLARVLAGSPALAVEECLRTEIPYHRFGAYWSALVIKAQRFFASQNPEDVLLIRYEALLESPASQLKLLAPFITGKAAPAAWLADSCTLVSGRPSGWQSLSQSEREALEASCKPGSRSLSRWMT